MNPDQVAKLDQLGAELRVLADLFGHYYVNLKKAGCSAPLARELVVNLQEHFCTPSED